MDDQDPSQPAPWERRYRETAKAYEGFRAFLIMAPPRSVSRLTVTYRNAKQWSAKYDWYERAAAYDASLLREFRDRQAEQLDLALAKQNDLAHAILAKLEDPDSHRQALALARAGDIIRKALGWVPPRGDIIQESNATRGVSQEAIRRIEEARESLEKEGMNAERA